MGVLGIILSGTAFVRCLAPPKPPGSCKLGPEPRCRRARRRDPPKRHSWWARTASYALSASVGRMSDDAGIFAPPETSSADDLAEREHVSRGAPAHSSQMGQKYWDGRETFAPTHVSFYDRPRPQVRPQAKSGSRRCRCSPTGRGAAPRVPSSAVGAAGRAVNVALFVTDGLVLRLRLRRRRCLPSRPLRRRPALSSLPRRSLTRRSRVRRHDP